MNAKQLLIVVLVALFASVFVSAQAVSEQAHKQQLVDFLKTIKNARKNLKFTNKLIKVPPMYYNLTAEELAKSYWKKALKVVGEIGKAAIKSQTNKNWDEIPEEEADFKFGKLFKSVLPYLKAGAKMYINNNWDQEEMADKRWAEVIRCIHPYIKAGVKSQMAKNNWDEQADGWWSSIWEVVKEIGKNAAKSYINSNWDNEMEMSDKFWGKIWKVVQGIGKGAIKSYVNQNYDEAADSEFSFSDLFKAALPYIRAGVKQYINTNWDQEQEMSDFKFKKLLKGAFKIAKHLGKAYIRTQYGIPLADMPQSHKFYKNCWRVARQHVKEAGKQYGKKYVTSNFAEAADSEFSFSDLFKAALPYIRAGVKQYINTNWDQEQEMSDFKFKKLLKGAFKIAKHLGKAYIRTQYGIPLADMPQSTEFYKNCWRVARHHMNEVEKKRQPFPYMHKNWDEEADIDYERLFKIALPYIRGELIHRRAL